ncbi:MAG: anthranilate synthase component I family protein [Actinobacteria bacterium]|nr:anthranilate synthase component I family protein [Actinomycetota bacterium]
MSENVLPHAPAAWVDPARVFAGVSAQHPDVFWLDAGPGASDGWSWIGAGDPATDDEVRATICAPVNAGVERVAGRFEGGWVGWLGYEPAARRAGAPAHADEPEVPGAMWLRTTLLIGFDHEARRVWVSAADSVALANDVVQWDAAGQHAANPDAANPDAAPEQPRRVAHQRHSPEEYAALIERCRGAIREGDAYQLCLTTRFSVPGPVDAIAAYLALRERTPAHHGGFLRSGGVVLASASPERFLEVDGGMVHTRPIKGTRPRGTDAASDVALVNELLASPKERAENVMIVDLMRNDLSRICTPGTVTVTGLLEVETYPAVHQLVSTVEGAIAPNTSVGDLLDACFPAGSMTGAPKLSAMTILHELEGAPRGVFSGCFGWVGHDGALDLAMVIRSIVVHADGAYVGAGGGITWGSDPAAEVAEVGVKARAPLAALGAELPPGW